jgi:hypothetical protein
MDATTSAKRSRLQSPEPYSKTTVYVVCHKPYKATLSLPKFSRLSKDVVKEAIAVDGNCPALPKLPYGRFEVVFPARDDGTQVALFKFRDVAGCRSVNSTQHDTLPVPRVRPIPLGFLVQPTTLQVGFHYMFGYNHPYKIEDGKVHLESLHPPQGHEFTDELHRTGEMLTRLRETSHCNHTIELASHDSTHYCPFSGGGDIWIYRTGSNLGAVLVTPAEQEPAEDTTLLEHASPSQEGQYTCGAVENKVGSCQREGEVRLQLQANMMLLCTKLLVQEIVEGHDVKQLVCYGVALGVVKYPLMLLKLTIDFDKRETVYDELCTISPCPTYPAFIDLALTYVIKNV